MMAYCLRHLRCQDLHLLSVASLDILTTAPTLFPIMTITNQRPVQHLSCTHFRTHTNTEPRRSPPLHHSPTRLPALKTPLHLSNSASSSSQLLPPGLYFSRREHQYGLYRVLQKYLHYPIKLALGNRGQVKRRVHTHAHTCTPPPPSPPPPPGGG
jgi:hypothetical protein